MASDTSLVFNLLGRDNVSKVLDAVKRSFREAGKEASTAMDAATRATQKLERELDSTQRKIDQLDSAAVRAAAAQEAAANRLATAQERHNSLVERGATLESQKEGFLARVTTAQERYNALLEQEGASEKDKAAALAKVETAQARYDSLLIRIRANEDQRAAALRRVALAEGAVAASAEKATKLEEERAKLVGQFEDIKTRLTQLKNSQDDAGQSASRFFNMLLSGASSVGTAAGRISQFGSTVSAIAGPIWTVVSAILAMVGAFAALGPAVALAGGALGSLPGLIGGGLASFGTLKLGLFGLSSEYDRLTKKVGGGGGGATRASKDFTAANRAVESAVRGVATAERDVAQAQAEALAAQKAVNDARETASKRMRDQSLELASARLDQKDADQAVIDAQNAYNAAVANNDPTAANAAAEALERAKIQAAEAKNKVDDLTEANAKNAKTGVEGSDEVVAAKKQEAAARQRVADSIEQEKEAEERLQDARKSLADQKKQGASGGGGGGAGQQITQLAPAARQFLDTILKLRPAFTALRLDVQQHLFAGLAGPLQVLAQRWLPQLHKTLGGFADTFNGIAKTAFATASKKTFIDNMAKGAEAFRKVLGEIGKAIAGPLLDAFGRLSAASAPFIGKLGDLLTGLVTKFSDFIKKADDSGKLKSFFAGAASTLQKVWDLGTNVAKVVGKLIEIIYPTSKATGDGVLDAANNALTSISDWLNDPKNQQKVRDVAKDIQDWVTQLEGFLGKVRSLSSLVGPAFKLLEIFIQGGTDKLRLLSKAWDVIEAGIKWIGKNGPRAWDSTKSGITSAYNWVVSKGGQIVTWVRNLPGRIGRAAAGMFDGIKNAFRGAVNWVISKWNGLSFTVGGGSFLGMSIPSQSLGTPDIPYLAKGGTIDRAGMAVVGERGPELVHLSRGAQVTPLSGGQGGHQIVITIDPSGGDAELARLIARMLRVKPGFAATVKKYTS